MFPHFSHIPVSDTYFSQQDTAPVTLLTFLTMSLKPSGPTGVRTRYSVHELQTLHDEGADKKPLENLMIAWEGIQKLHPTELKSFFTLGGYHGEPFTGPGAIDDEWWGGYCNHGNVLFPTWHRAYVLKIEEALQSIVPEVTMPYWDETNDASLRTGIPHCLTDETFTFSDGRTIKNPLKSYVLPESVRDSAKGDYAEYRKKKGYETVRYPLSGLQTVGAREHNKHFPDPTKRTELLNTNVVAWLTGDEGDKISTNPPAVFILDQYKSCLTAPNYTLFSNTVSAANDNANPKKKTYIYALEAPHNDVHLSVGGFYSPRIGKHKKDNEGLITGSNGDMGENNTAALDPIFFFHHCNVDRMFWLWQKKQGFTDNFDIAYGDAGASSNTSGQGPTPFFEENVPLTMDSPLLPFMINQLTDPRIYTSRDVINIETQLGYTYSTGSLEDYELPGELEEVRKLIVTGLDRTMFTGSFVVVAFAKVDKDEIFLGHNSVLSRFNVKGCANCLTHLKHTAVFSLKPLTVTQIQNAHFILEVRDRSSTTNYEVHTKKKIDTTEEWNVVGYVEKE